MVGEERSLQDALLADAAQISTAECVHRLLAVSRRLLDAIAAFHGASVRLPATLGTIAADGTQPRYIGPMPACDEPFSNTEGGHVEVDIHGVLSQYMSEPLRSLIANQPAETLSAGLQAEVLRSPRTRDVAECLRQLCAAN